MNLKLSLFSTIFTFLVFSASALYADHPENTPEQNIPTIEPSLVAPPPDKNTVQYPSEAEWKLFINERTQENFEKYENKIFWWTSIHIALATLLTAFIFAVVVFKGKDFFNEVKKYKEDLKNYKEDLKNDKKDAVEHYNQTKNEMKTILEESHLILNEIKECLDTSEQHAERIAVIDQTLQKAQINNIGETEGEPYSEKLLKKAKDDDADAQYRLAEIYYSGDGVTANRATAKEWLEKTLANNKNNNVIFKAKTLLGIILICDPASTETDKYRAIDLFKDGAFDNNSNAQTFLGGLLCQEKYHIRLTKGDGVKLLARAAQQGSDGAKDILEKIFKKPFKV